MMKATFVSLYIRRAESRLKTTRRKDKHNGAFRKFLFPAMLGKSLKVLYVAFSTVAN